MPESHNARELPRIDDIQAMQYGVFGVRRIAGPPVRVEAVEPPPPATAWSRELLEHNDGSVVWDGERIDLNLDNGSWTWVAEAQSLDGRVVYARWPD